LAGENGAAFVTGEQIIAAGNGALMAALRRYFVESKRS
jgi:hypothetical protein